MKKSKYILLIIFAVGLFFAACDPADMDNPVKVRINPEEDTVKPDPRIYIYDAEWLFFEIYLNKDSVGTIFDWKNNFNIIRNTIIADTLENELSSFSIDFEAETTLPDSFFPNRDDRVISFRMLLDSVSIFRMGSFSDLIDKGFIELKLKELNNNNQYILYL